MGSVFLVVLSLLVFFLAYRCYGKYIAKRVFRADDSRVMPSIDMKDGIDYVPTKKEVLFGHHFASISGTGPIVGPAIAVIWGWVPAVLWIIIGSVFAGSVHDYAAIIMSVRGKGLSVGELSESIISPRMKLLFSSVIFFLLWIVVAIFGMVIAIIFQMYPQAVLPVWFQIPLAVVVGYLAYRKNFSMFAMSVIAVILLYVSIFAGIRMPFVMPEIAGFSGMSIWIVLLFLYAFVASVLPVWVLLQPRDYINSHQLIAGLFLILTGVFVARPEIVAPAFQISPEGAPPIVPFLFITIACGAISGFHSLIGSGTTSKQLKRETDAKMIGFGGMLTEGLLGILVVVAVAAGIGMYVRTAAGDVLTGTAAWRYHYPSWQAADGLANQVTAFVNGSANMIESFGIPILYAQALVGVLIASFAGTTLDTATRIQRYIVSEVASARGIRPLENRYFASALVVAAATILAFSQVGGKGALLLWPLFGSSNQLLAGLVLLVATVYLLRRKSGFAATAIPMIFMIAISVWGISIVTKTSFFSGDMHIFVIGCILIVLKIWMVIEVFFCLRKILPDFSVRP